MATEILNLGGIRDRAQQCILDIWWKDKRFDYDVSDNCIYAGFNRLHDAGILDTEWVVSKYTWSVAGNCERVETLTGTWDGRASLGWGV
jgi:hypothetical protein